jgi:hypothetical protein
MKSKLIKILILFFLNGVGGCATREINYHDPVELLEDNLWIDKNTIQIQVEASNDENIPYSLRRQNSCIQAKESIKNIFEKTYPGSVNLPYRFTIFKTLYTEKNNCRLVVHIYMKNLKEKIQ